MKSLENAENLFGQLSKNIEKRIKRFITSPTFDNWDDISSIIVNRNFTTVWQAILEINPSFTKQGRTYDSDDNIINEWNEIPTPMDVLRAIRKVTN